MIPSLLRVERWKKTQRPPSRACKMDGRSSSFEVLEAYSGTLEVQELTGVLGRGLTVPSVVV
jgi:hypothetical protein